MNNFIDNLRKDKEALEKNILQALRNLEQTYGVSITDFDMLSSDEIGSRGSRVINVKLYVEV